MVHEEKGLPADSSGRQPGLPAEAGTTASWDDLRARLRERVGDTAYEHWLAAVELDWVEDSLLIRTPNLFIRDWIERRYRDDIVTVAREALGRDIELKFRVVGELYRKFREAEASFHEGEQRADRVDGPAGKIAPRSPGGSSTGDPSPGGSSPADPSPADPSRAGKPSAARSPVVKGLDRRLTLEKFVVGSCNHMAYQAGLEILGKPGRSYNPLFIYGGCGLGKTHLVQGITRRFLNQRPGRARYWSGEEFANRFIRSVRESKAEKFRQELHSLKVLVVDDVQILSGKTHTQEALLQGIDAISTAGGQVVLASDTLPRGIEKLKKQLVGRFVSGLVCRLEPPDYPTRVAILRQEAEGMKVEIPTRVLHAVAEAGHGNVRELTGALIKVAAVSALTNERLTDARVAEVLADEAPARPGRLLDAIVTAVSRRHGPTADQLRSRSRRRSVSAARKLAIFLARTLSDHSLSEIGEYFGGRNHSTVASAYKCIRRRLDDDEGLQREIEALKNEVRG